MKRTVMVIVLMIILFLAGCKENSSGGAKDAAYLCSDSDEGNDYFTAGNAVGVTDSEMQGVMGVDANHCLFEPKAVSETTYYDCCVDSATSKLLKEAYCNKKLLDAVLYECPNGCMDGACVR